MKGARGFLEEAALSGHLEVEGGGVAGARRDRALSTLPGQARPLGTRASCFPGHQGAILTFLLIYLFGTGD